MLKFAILPLLLTLGAQIFSYLRTKNRKKLFTSLGILALLVAFTGAGVLLRVMPPLFYIHFFLIIFAWGGLVVYMIRDKFYWWSIFAPFASILLFLILEEIMGSGHDFF